MSFLKNAWRESKSVKQYRASEFGSYSVQKDSFPSLLSADGEHSGREFSVAYLEGSYEDPDQSKGQEERSRHFFNTMHKLMEKLAQAEFHGDFGLNAKNFENSDPVNKVSKKLAPFMRLRSNIYESLEAFRGADKKDIAAWFKANQKLIGDFLTELDVIYKLRTPGAKFKDLLWELADALLVVLAAVGLAAVVIHLAGVGIFAGAFAHFVAPAAVTATIVEGATAVTALVATGLFKAVYSERREIKAAIEKDLRTTIATS